MKFSSLFPVWKDEVVFKLSTLSILLLFLIPNGVAEENSENDDDTDQDREIHNMIVDDWYELIRYLVGLSLCIFGLIGMYFHQFASYYFLKQYAKPLCTERRVGRVLSCEPIVRVACEKRTKTKKKNKKRSNMQRITQQCPGVCVTDYVREEDIDRHLKDLGMQFSKPQQQCIEYRMLVEYTVQRNRQESFLCCSPIDADLAMTFTNSFSVASFKSDRRDDGGIEVARSKSLPSSGAIVDDNLGIPDVSTKGEESANVTKYYQWFQTSKLRPINTNIDLILLKGQPRSACTPELIQSHLEEVGIVGDRDNEHFWSLSITGLVLIVTIIILGLVCASEILEMPKPESQRPLGFAVLGAVCLGSIVIAYVISKLMFEHYKRTVFLSSFSVPSMPSASCV